MNLIFKGGCREESLTKCGEQGSRLFAQTFHEQTKSNSPNLVFDSQHHQRWEIFVFFSSRSFKKWERYISFVKLVLAQFIYFLREVCLVFISWITINNYVKKHIIVNFVVQKLKSKHNSLKNIQNWAKITEHYYIFFSI